MRLLPILLLAGLGFGGCISNVSGIEADEEDVPWKAGVTTRKDVVSQWGNPDAIRGRTWVWDGARAIGGKFKVGYMMIGFTLSNVEASKVSCELTFGDDGRLVGKRIVDAVATRPEWSVDPF